MNPSITLALGMMALLYITSSNAIAQGPALAQRPAPLLDVVDSVRIISAIPPADTHLARGKPVTIDVKIDYNLASEDKAWLNVSIGEMPATPPNCGASAQGELTDAFGIDIVRGTHQITMSLVWSGDTGAKSKGRVYDTGYIGLFPSFWTADHKQRLTHFRMAPGYCYPFGSE